MYINLIFNYTGKEAYAEEIANEYRELRDNHYRTLKDRKYYSLEAARARAPKVSIRVCFVCHSNYATILHL